MFNIQYGWSVPLEERGELVRDGLKRELWHLAALRLAERRHEDHSARALLQRVLDGRDVLLHPAHRTREAADAE